MRSMQNFLTSKQVQDLFKIDGFTVYRMVVDGRWKGINIGNQWRFTESEIERLLSGVSLPEEVESESVFPTHCVQTIQNLYSSVTHFNAFVIDQNGELVTRKSRDAAFCKLIQLSSSGKSACSESWKDFIESSKAGKTNFVCRAGLSYVGAPIFSQKRMQGLFISGPFFFESPLPEELEKQSQILAEAHHLDQSELQIALQQVPVLSKEQRENLSDQPSAAAQAIESILTERSVFMDRLQQIASLTQNI